MISIIGLGNAASAIAEKFADTSNYNVYLMNSNIHRASKYKFKLKKYDKPEEYEKNIPNVKKFLKGIDNDVQFIVTGASYSSNYALGILEQIKDKKVNVFYIKPDTELLTGVPRLIESCFWYFTRVCSFWAFKLHYFVFEFKFGKHTTKRSS